MKRISAVLAVLLVLMSLSGCGCDNTDHYSTPYVDVQTISELSAPPVGEGEYTMCCTFLQTAVYRGQEYYMSTEWDMKSWYDFTAAPTENGLRLEFSIARRSYVYSYNDTSTVVFDTIDERTRNEDTQIYFDLIGHGFTVDFDGDYRVSAIGGTEALYKEVEGAEYLLGEAEIRAIAEELLLTMPDTLTKETSVIHSQTIDGETSMEMKYDVSKLSDTVIGFEMSPVSEYGVPENETGSGYTIEYTDAADYSGALNIAADDRLVQSSSNQITYYSIMEVTADNGSGYALEGQTTVTDSCQVEKIIKSADRPEEARQIGK